MFIRRSVLKIVKVTTPLAVSLICLFCPATSVHSSSGGSPPGYTGVPAGGKLLAEETCVTCHESYSLNPDTAGKIELLGVPDLYVPGHHYGLTFRISHPDATRWGFQLTAVSAGTFLGAGDFTPAPGDKNTQRITGGIADRVYIEHGPAGKGATGLGQRNGFAWHFDWIAPLTNIGEVLFFGVGNAANGDGSAAGDKIYGPSTPLARTSGAGTQADNQKYRRGTWHDSGL
jgi:hypothetical protein